MFPMYGVGHGSFGMLLGSVWFLLAIGVAAAIVVIMTRPSTPPGSPPTSLSPEDIVRQRYARGEIDEAEFNRLLENLRTTGLR
jgi:putative membrane protein